MSSASPIEPFRGNGTWEECNTFIQAVRAAGWKEGKLRDNAWMADFASLHFSHEALVWYSQLPEDVSQDWSKLQNSILTRWAPSKDDDGGRAKIGPTPAAASSPDRSGKCDYLLYGALKLVADGANKIRYVKFDGLNVPSSLTSDVSKALRVRYNSGSTGTLLERIDQSSHFLLAVQWQVKMPKIGEGSTDCAHLVLVDSDTLKTGWDDCPFQLIKCTVLKNGEVSLAWKKDQIKVPLFPFIYDFYDGDTFFATDPVAYSRSNPEDERAKLFLEPIG